MHIQIHTILYLMVLMVLETLKPVPSIRPQDWVLIFKETPKLSNTAKAPSLKKLFFWHQLVYLLSPLRVVLYFYKFVYNPRESS